MKATLLVLFLCCLVPPFFGQKSLDELKKNATPDDRKAERLAIIAYFKTAGGMLAEEGVRVENWFTLGRTVEGLGKEGDRIATVHVVKLGIETRGLVLVNLKAEKCLVVFPLVSDTVHCRALEGNLLGDAADRSVLVYPPPSYDSTRTKRYPVVYLLHGNTLRNTLWTEGRLQGLNIKTALDALIADGTIREMIDENAPIFL